jgi:hypothetical protein
MFSIHCFMKVSKRGPKCLIKLLNSELLALLFYYSSYGHIYCKQIVSILNAGLRLCVTSYIGVFYRDYIINCCNTNLMSMRPVCLSWFCQRCLKRFKKLVRWHVYCMKLCRSMRWPINDRRITMKINGRSRRTAWDTKESCFVLK